MENNNYFEKIIRRKKYSKHILFNSGVIVISIFSIISAILLTKDDISVNNVLSTPPISLCFTIITFLLGIKFIFLDGKNTTKLQVFFDIGISLLMFLLMGLQIFILSYIQSSVVYKNLMQLAPLLFVVLVFEIIISIFINIFDAIRIYSKYKHNELFKNVSILSSYLIIIASFIGIIIALVVVTQLPDSKTTIGKIEDSCSLLAFISTLAVGLLYVVTKSTLFNKIFLRRFLLQNHGKIRGTFYIPVNIHFIFATILNIISEIFDVLITLALILAAYDISGGTNKDQI